MARQSTVTKFYLVLLLLIIVVFFNAVSIAALPTRLNYQGYLTTAQGEPIDTSQSGPINVTFRLYTLPDAVSEVWSDTYVMEVSKGLFSVELNIDSAVSAEEFENTLYLGIQLPGDAEMLPRKALSISAYAVKAMDANALQGLNGAFVSEHINDQTENPHKIDATQIGAATSVELNNHKNNSSAHHNKTQSFSELIDQAGDHQIPADITRDSELNIHAGISNAHHSRFTFAEAITAMGPESDINPLNHTKFSNVDAVVAIKSADGAGSTLDADLLDGMQASEVIAAAKDEIRTAISELPYTISTSGSYFITNTLIGGGGIDITADNVTLDLMGFSLQGNNAADYGIYLSGRSNITIKNGTIRDYGYAGIYQGTSTGSFVTLEHIKVLNNGTLGSSVAYSGIFLGGRNHHVENCTAGSNGGYGIYVYEGSIVKNNIAFGNAGAYGIFGGSGTHIVKNVAHSNASNYGIYGGAANLIKENSVYSNSNWGIFASTGSIVKDNVIVGNNKLNIVSQGGMRISYDTQVTGNTLEENRQSNIYVYGDDNVLENNLVVGSTNGIFFNNSGNFYANNRASGNVSNYELGATSQTNGGGNYSF